MIIVIVVPGGSIDPTQLSQTAAELRMISEVTSADWLHSKPTSTFDTVSLSLLSSGWEWSNWNTDSPNLVDLIWIVIKPRYLLIKFVRCGMENGQTAILAHQTYQIWCEKWSNLGTVSLNLLILIWTSVKLRYYLTKPTRFDMKSRQIFDGVSLNLL